ncbi:MAG: T9SS type A sorting domain-containing protein [Bacteroidales bacterium]
MRSLHFKKRVLLWVFFIICIPFSAWSQHVFVSSGGSSSQTGGTVSYSLGQIFYTVASGSTGHAFQGIQLPYEIYQITDIIKSNDVRLQFLAYPNPVYDQLILQVSDTLKGNLSYQLVDIHGRLLKEGRIYVREMAIPFDGYLKGSYILFILKEGSLMQAFKIIKK